jgi:hypothetical protein
VEPETCPKCGAARALVVRDACPRCGLALPHWSSYDAAIPPHPVLDPAFAALQPSWSELAAHDAFIALAREAGALDAAALRYRGLLRERAADEQAQEALHRIAVLAAHAQQHAPRDRLPGMRALFWVATALAAVMLAVVAAVIWRVLSASRL